MDDAADDEFAGGAEVDDAADDEFAGGAGAGAYIGAATIIGSRLSRSLYGPFAASDAADDEFAGGGCGGGCKGIPF